MHYTKRIIILLHIMCYGGFSQLVLYYLGCMEVTGDSVK